jgi:glycosyltransferase involved in cell wall biosynthesis
MKVLFVSNDPSVFSEGSALRARMREYASVIGTVHLISAAPKNTPPTIREDVPGGTLTLHAVTLRKPFSFLELKKRATEIVIKEGIEIVSAQDPFEYGWIAQHAVKGTKAKLHIQIHTDFLSPWFTRRKIYRSAKSPMPYFNIIRKRIADRVIPSAQGIRVVSKRVYESLITRYEKRIPEPSIIPLRVSSTVPPAVPLPPHDFTFALLTVGRIELEKRMEDMLYALHKITDNYPAVGLLIVGDGRERKRLEKLTHMLGLGSKVQFLGSRPDAWGLMQSAQAYIQSEAALARVPIITTDVGIVGEVFHGYEDVLSAPVADAAALATHIRGLVEDNTIRKEFVTNAEKTAREHLASVHTGPEAIAADLQKLLQ